MSNVNVLMEEDTRPLMKPIKGYLSAYDLTDRETEILYAICVYGFSNEEIGDLYSISHHTVKNHVSRILVKMNAGSIREIQSSLLRYLIHAHQENILINGKGNGKAPCPSEEE